MTSERSRTTLRTLLMIFAIIEVIAGLALVFACQWLVSVVSVDPNVVKSVLVSVLLKLFGAISFAFAYLSYSAARDPERYVAFIDALIFLLLVAAVIDVYGVVVLHVAPFFPGFVVWLRALIRVALAVLLIALRPSGASQAHAA